MRAAARAGARAGVAGVAGARVGVVRGSWSGDVRVASGDRSWACRAATVTATAATAATAATQWRSFVRSVSTSSSNRSNLYNNPSNPSNPSNSPRNMSSTTSASPASRLRAVLASRGLNAYLVPSGDAHNSEYVAACDSRRAYVSGFTGSAGFALVVVPPSSNPTLRNQLWTDGRYFLQGERQLDAAEWELRKQGMAGDPSLTQWLLKNLPAGSKMGVDPTLVDSQWRTDFLAAVEDHIELVLPADNLVDAVWADRPARPEQPLIVLSESYTGEAVSSKIAKLRKSMADKHVHALVVSALDEVAWLLNLRGSDVQFNPVFFAYVVITASQVVLYVNPVKVTDEVRAHLGDLVTIKPYDAFFGDLVSEIKPALSRSARAWFDPTKSSFAIASAFDSSVVYGAASPIALMKAVKNEAELEGMRQAHLRDAVAMCRFFTWLEAEVRKPDAQLTECVIADRAEHFRSQEKDFMGLSFDTIAGSGANGAIIHYKPEPATCAPVNTSQMLLLDSGGQYRDGTTDITRTVHLGEPSEFERIAFTRVLQGHIGLASPVFSTNTVGPSLDALARIPLWRDGLDYLHGTGHGVGSFLNVHEGPHGISASTRSATMLNTPLQAGMVVTNEPGYYHDGVAPVSAQAAAARPGTEKKFGVRIESVLIVRVHDTPHRFLQRQFLSFETITLVPIQRSLIRIDLLTDAEIEWLNAYHRTCLDKVGPLLQARQFDDVYAWLEHSCEPIRRA